jgi:putative membrane protein
LAIGLFGAANGNLTYIYLAAVFFIPSFLVAVFRYFTLRYVLVDGELRVTSGLFFRTMRVVPISRIQNVDLVQNVLHRMFAVAEVKIETASGTEPEAVLRVLSLRQIEELRAGIFADRNLATVKTVETSADDSNDHVLPQADVDLICDATDSTTTEKTLLKIPIGWLIRAGLASNRGWIMGVIAGLFVQFDVDELFAKFGISDFLEALPVDWGVAAMVLYGVGFTVLILVVFKLLGIVWFILKFFGYTLNQRGEDLRISCGLLTKVSATVPLRRIQFISIHQNFLMRRLGMASIRIETAGGSSAKAENAAATVSRRWFVPVIPLERVPEILNLLRADLKWDPSQLDWQPLAPRAWARMARLAVFFPVLILLIGVAVNRPWGFVPGAVLLPLALMYARKKSRSMRYARTKYGVVYRSGLLTHKTSVTFFERIQTLTVKQSPIDRRWRMACLTVDTAAAGPADHQISIPFLDEEFANAEFDQIAQRSARHQPAFG